MDFGDTVRETRAAVLQRVPRLLPSRWLAGPGGAQRRPSHRSTSQVHMPARHAGKRTTVIVVGSTTTALLIEALAEAGMLRTGSRSTRSQPVDMVRTAEWSTAEEICRRLARCVVVHDLAAAPPRHLVDREGRAVRVVEAETILETARRERGGSVSHRSERAPHRTGGPHRWSGLLRGGRALRMFRIRTDMLRRAGADKPIT